MKEREISLIDLLSEILLHWRQIIVWMLVGGVVIGGFGYAKAYINYRNASAGENPVAGEEVPEVIDKETLEEALTEIQTSNVTTVLAYEKMYSDTSYYQDNSILMKINPSEIYRTEMTFVVKALSPDTRYDLGGVYEKILSSAGFYDYLAKENGISSNAVSEIVTVESYSGDFQDINAARKVVVICDTEGLCNSLEQSIENYINMKHARLTEELEVHEIVVADRSLAVVSDADLLKKQQVVKSDLLSMQSTAARLKDAFTGQEWLYYNFLLHGKADVPEQNAGTSGGIEIPRISIKYVVLGMALAVFLYVFIIFLCYVLSMKLRAMDSLQEIYGIPQLGQIPAQKKKKFLGQIDELIRRMQNGSKRRFSFEEAMELTAVAVRMTALKADIKTISIIGCDLKDTALHVCSEIREKITEEDFHIEILNNVIYNAEAMERLSYVQGVVLVETAGSTLCDEISKELDLMKRQGIPVLGGIIVEP